MKKSFILRVVIMATAAACLLQINTAQAAEKDQKPPVAQYWMNVSTQNQTIPGMPDMGGMFGKMGGPSRSLLLQLSSPQTPPKDPEAVNDIPEGQHMGKALPLMIPIQEKRAERMEKAPEEQVEKPKVRMLIYWGCSEDIGKGQPKIIDTEKMGPVDFGKALTGHSISMPHPPSPRQGWVYSEWPNKKTRTEIPRDSSLTGEQFVHGNYTTDIRFKIGPMHDFMAPVEFTSVRGGLSDSVQFEWKAVPTAIGYFATAMAHNEKSGEMIIWSSSEVPDPGFSLMNYIPSPEVRRLIKEKVIMAPETTSCKIPKGIFKGADGSMMQFIAYGEDLNVSYPSKPKDPVWAVKVRLKSTGMLMLGASDSQEEHRSARKPKRGADREDEQSAEPEKKDEGREDSGSPINKIKGIFGF